MHLFTGFLKAGSSPVRAACEGLARKFPALMRHAIVIGVPVPEILLRIDGRLNGYAMCLNHWLRFLPVPVILLNAKWFSDVGNLESRYQHDVATCYHPDCGCPFRYVMAHEIGHFVYLRLNPAEKERWVSSYVQGRPSGYSTSPEESFCEAFAMDVRYGLAATSRAAEAALARANEP